MTPSFGLHRQAHIDTQTLIHMRERGYIERKRERETYFLESFTLCIHIVCPIYGNCWLMFLGLLSCCQGALTSDSPSQQIITSSFS